MCFEPSIGKGEGPGKMVDFYQHAANFFLGSIPTQKVLELYARGKCFREGLIERLLHERRSLKLLEHRKVRINFQQVKMSSNKLQAKTVQSADPCLIE